VIFFHALHSDVFSVLQLFRCHFLARFPISSEVRHHPGLLGAVEYKRDVTQRGSGSKLGIAVGLTDMYLKQLARKGYVKCVNIRPGARFRTTFAVAR
jgi:hypothetical protein